jgi:hypothetical protein
MSEKTEHTKRDLIRRLDYLDEIWIEVLNCHTRDDYAEGAENLTKLISQAKLCVIDFKMLAKSKKKLTTPER